MAHLKWISYCLGVKRHGPDHVYGECSECAQRFTMFGNEAGYPKACPFCGVVMDGDTEYKSHDALADHHLNGGSFPNPTTPEPSIPVTVSEDR